MEYKLRVLEDDEKTHFYEYDVNLGGIDYPNMKSIIEKLTVSIEENIHPITIDIAGHIGGAGYFSYFKLYFSRKLAKEWLHRLSPCTKSGGAMKFRAVNW